MSSTQQRTPTIARMYDYYLGGTENFDVDREAADRVIAAVPDIVTGVRQNRAFLRRAVRFLAAERGIDQFIDIGAGLPTQGNVHEIAHAINPGARVVYVDFDAEVVDHASRILTDQPNTAAIVGDVREPDAILGHERVRELIDLGRPVAVLMIAVMHFIPDEEKPAAVVSRYREAMVPGSFLVFTHATADGIPPEAAASAMKVYRSGVSPFHLRPHDQVAAQLEGFELLEPGLVNVVDWRQDTELSQDERHLKFYGAVALRS